MREICGNCRFYRLAENECRRYPPTLIIIGDARYGGFPPITSQTWCGEFRPYTDAAAVEREPAAVPPQPAVAAALQVDRRQEAVARGFTGDSCARCGSLSMRRIGTCLTCQVCGSTTGCA